MLTLNVNQELSFLPLTEKDPALQDSQESECGRAAHQELPHEVKRSRGKVAFGYIETFSIVPSHTHVSETDIWYSKEEMESMRSDYVQDAKKVARANKTSDGALLRTYEACSKGERTLDSKLVEELRICLEDPTTTGLERMAARRIHADKKFRRYSLVEAVFGIQDRLSYDHEKRSNALRFASEAISVSSVLFAHQLAVASYGATD